MSVVVTTKNSGTTLGKLLQSIKNQTFKDLEIIVVDNHSTDSTIAVAKKYTQKVFKFGPERSAQRNFGAKLAKGKYLLFLDADMELAPDVVGACVTLADQGLGSAIIIPEKTVGKGLMQDIRRFEREMYEGDESVELARFYSRGVFKKSKGFDESLTGPEDYDLFYRIKAKHKQSFSTNKVGRIKSYILHHEEGLTLAKLLQKKFYYAKKGAIYADKHPELISKQGTILFRKAYLKHWRKFLLNPIIGICFVFTRTLETIWAVAGYISAVGPVHFMRKLFKMFNHLI